MTPIRYRASDAVCCAVGHGFESRKSRRATSPLKRLVKGEEKREAPDQPQDVLLQNWGENELNRSVTCMVLTATVNDRRYLALHHDEFSGPRSGLCRSGGISNNNNIVSC
ncbi:uncharacterized protein TNCV_5126731 [Trichonephila clavipes]|nr:uncharacterized protein TNCV_5126731 [Trichonephila clavipes]